MKSLHLYIKILYSFQLKLSYLAVICLLGFTSHCYAQENNMNVQKSNQSNDLTKQDQIKNLANELYLDNSRAGTANYGDLSDSVIVSIELPPLSVLFENMGKNPTYKQAYIKYQQDLIAVGQEKRDPLDWISPYANYNYGMNSGLTTNSASTAVSLVTNTNNEVKTYYNVGIGFSTTFGELFNYFSNVKSAQLQASYSKAQMEQAELEIKQKIIQLYLTIQAQEEELKVDMELVNIYASAFKIAEGEFANGEQEARSLAEIKMEHSRAISTYQGVKVNFISNLMFLELITHTKIR